MVSQGEADFLLVLDAGQIEVNRAMLAPGGLLIEPGVLRGRTLRSSKALNVALVGALSRQLDFADEVWTEALRVNLPPKLVELNLEAFAMGRNSSESPGSAPPARVRDLTP
jgi:indolepyruvate ferredoxin oxidoreductase beta subunit